MKPAHTDLYSNSSSTFPRLSSRNSSRTLSMKSCHTLTSSLATRPKPPHSPKPTVTRPRTSRKLRRRLPACLRRTPTDQGPSSSPRAPTPPSPSPQRTAVTSMSRRCPCMQSPKTKSTTPTVPVMPLPAVSSLVSSRVSRSKRLSTWASGSPSLASRSWVPRTRSPSKLTAAKRLPLHT